MPHATHTARVTGKLTYVGRSGQTSSIPPGPCLIEDKGEGVVDIIWGPQGEKSAALSVRELEEAEQSGSLVLLD